jgi:DNA-binding MarR family transcriptional regulator
MFFCANDANFRYMEWDAFGWDGHDSMGQGIEMTQPRQKGDGARRKAQKEAAKTAKAGGGAEPPECVFALETVVGYQLRRAYTFFAAHWQLEFRDKRFPITPVQGGMLVMIDANRNVTPTALARMMNVESPTLLQSLERLEELGHIRKLRNESDRRSYTLQLTPRGRKALAAVQAFGPEREQALLADLTPSERRQLIDMLTRVVGRGRQVVRGLQEEAAHSSRKPTDGARKARRKQV